MSGPLEFALDIGSFIEGLGDAALGAASTTISKANPLDIINAGANVLSASAKADSLVGSAPTYTITIVVKNCIQPTTTSSADTNTSVLIAQDTVNSTSGGNIIQRHLFSWPGRVCVNSYSYTGSSNPAFQLTVVDNHPIPKDDPDKTAKIFRITATCNTKDPTGKITCNSVQIAEVFSGPDKYVIAYSTDTKLCYYACGTYYDYIVTMTQGNTLNVEVGVYNAGSLNNLVKSLLDNSGMNAFDQSKWGNM